jgi:outer membrane protein assembly factor BamA
VNLSRRFQYALQGFSQKQFYYGYTPGQMYGYEYAYLDRDDAIATESAMGVTAYGIYPFNRYARMELSVGLMNFGQEYNDPTLQDLSDQYQEERYGRTLFSNGNIMPLGITFVQETTVFREYGPLAGNTVRVGYEFAPSGGGLLGRQIADVDARYYLRLATNGVLAFRAKGFKSWGDYPAYMYYGGNSEMRGYEYLEFIGNKAFFTNAELRFPIIEAALTPFGVIGGLRGVFFANLGANGFEGQSMNVWSTGDTPISAFLGYTADPTSLNAVPVFSPEIIVPGFKLIDGRASYGIGLETFALGFPIHFDWAWKTMFNKDYENLLFFYQGSLEGKSGSDWFRKPKFSVWIGYDF